MSNEEENIDDMDDVTPLLEFLKQNRGFDFSGYKRPSLLRRIAKRMQELNINTFAEYKEFLEVQPEEHQQLFDTILINVTSFFRDGPAWDYLAKTIIPHILANKTNKTDIRVWSASCASGEEAYTLAMLFAEALGISEFRQRVKIYATDIDGDALDVARKGTYTQKELNQVPEELRDRYFEQSGSRYSFRPDLRRCIIFGQLNLLQDAPISRLDLLVCRNTLMYFNAETQNKILTRFNFSLNETGFLFLGKAEMLLTHTDLFNPEILKYRIFTKVIRHDLIGQLAERTALTPIETENPVMERAIRLRELALEHSTLAQIIIDQDGTLVLANNKARDLFGLSEVDFGRAFRDMEISYRPLELRSRIEQALKERRVINIPCVEKHLPHGDIQYLDVHVCPLLTNGGSVEGVSISFNDMTHAHQIQAEYQRTSQELETAHEELQSSNEELETTNEELQSSNEELETTNEELQSSNEELHEINKELIEKSEKLDKINLFLGSILYSINAGAIAVDADYRITLWNEGSLNLWGLNADEVQGKKFLELDIGLPVKKLKMPVQNILKGKSENNIEIINLKAINRRGKRIDCQITCTPLLNKKGKVENVLMLMETQ